MIWRRLGLALLAMCVLAGCSDRRPKRVPVSGQVLIDGKPLGFGSIRLIPDNNREASGKIGSDGRFTLTTYGGEDGCVLGTHRVTVSALEQLGNAAQRWHAPKKYLQPDTSELTATITGPTDSLAIKLTWDGGQPFVERWDEVPPPTRRPSAVGQPGKK